MLGAFQKSYRGASRSRPVQRRVTAVVLAGGESSRFGRDKAFALWQGRTFLERVVEAAWSVSDAVLVLVPAGSRNLDYARHAPGATVLPDRDRGAGPVEALRGASMLLRTPFTLVAPCDAPGLPHGLARRLVAQAEESMRPAVVVTSDGPLFALFAIPTETLVARLPDARRLEDLLQDAERVVTDAEGLNVNEPGTERSH
jgi:molybdopterin-guanine dinucleotide biosynthesis protein A